MDKLIPSAKSGQPNKIIPVSWKEPRNLFISIIHVVVRNYLTKSKYLWRYGITRITNDFNNIFRDRQAVTKSALQQYL